MKFDSKKFTNFLSQHLPGIGIAVGILILIFGAFWFVIPQYREAKQLGGLNFSQKQSQLESDKDYLSKLLALRKGLNNIPQENIERISLIIPKGKDIPGIFKQMEKFAKEVNMSLLSVSVADGGVVASSTRTDSTAGAAASKIKTLSVSVVLGGSMNYPLMKNFLLTLSRQAPLLDLTSITYSPNTAAAPTSYNFSFRSYYFE